MMAQWNGNFVGVTKMKTALKVSKNAGARPLRNKQWPQYLAVIAACIASSACGQHFAWPSPFLSKLSAYNISSDEEAYIVIANPIGDIVGAPLAASFADVIGRKNGLLVIAAPLLASWLVVAFADTAAAFCAGRFISGVGDGILFIVLPMYIGEVTEPAVRGILGCSISVSMLIGMLAINGMGPYLSVRDAAFACLATPLLFLLCFVWMPESPYYLIMRGRMDEAKSSLRFLRGRFVDKDFELLVHDVRRQMSEQGTIRELFSIRSNRRALSIMAGVRTVQQLSGVAAIGIFTQNIFAQSASGLSPVLATLVYLATQLLVTICGSFLVERFGRKVPFMLSCFGTGVALLMGGAYFYLDQVTSVDLSSVHFLSVVIMLSFTVLFGIGLGTVPTLMLGELFSASIKCKALCAMCIYYSIIISITSKLFHYLNGNFGIYISFFTFGIFCIVNTIISFFFVPETKGKSLEDIQQYLKGNDNKKEVS